MMFRVSHGEDEQKEERQDAGLLSPRLIEINMTWLPIDEYNESGKE
jgi:hypothetical protein